MFSQEVKGEHRTGETYRYEIGVCVDVGREKDKNELCGVVQYNSNNTHSHCLGNVTKAQIARSKFFVLVD